MIAEVSDVGEENIAGGFAIMERYALLATVASAKTMRRLVSSIHFILKPPLAFSHSEKAS
jgi:hypothetical protein